MNSLGTTAAIANAAYTPVGTISGVQGQEAFAGTAHTIAHTGTVHAAKSFINWVTAKGVDRLATSTTSDADSTPDLILSKVKTVSISATN